MKLQPVKGTKSKFCYFSVFFLFESPDLVWFWWVNKIRKSSFWSENWEEIKVFYIAFWCLLKVRISVWQVSNILKASKQSKCLPYLEYILKPDSILKNHKKLPRITKSRVKYNFRMFHIIQKCQIWQKCLWLQKNRQIEWITLFLHYDLLSIDIKIFEM